MSSNEPRDPRFMSQQSAVERRAQEIRNRSSWDANEARLIELMQMEQRAQHKAQFGESQVDVPMISEDELEQIAFYDSQTQTYNFRYLMRKMRRELSRAKRYKRTLSIAVVAVDNYTKLAMNYSILAQEEVIKAAGQILLAVIRTDIDMVGRYGDGRFIVILPETPGSGAQVFGDRLRRQFEQYQIRYQFHTIPLSVSVGVSFYPGHGRDVEELLAQADLAAEIVEQRGGNGVAFAEGGVGSGG